MAKLAIISFALLLTLAHAAPAEKAAEQDLATEPLEKEDLKTAASHWGGLGYGGYYGGYGQWGSPYYGGYGYWPSYSYGYGYGWPYGYGYGGYGYGGIGYGNGYWW